MRPYKAGKAPSSALEAWAAIFATGGPHREERQAAAVVAKETREFWLPILEELWRDAKREGREDSASLFLLENEIRRLRRELASEAPSPEQVGRLHLRNCAQVRRYQREKKTPNRRGQ